jgi:hypothetical protein
LIPRRVRLATLLAFGLHGILILSARYRLSFDAYTHMFFADHYLYHWGTLWDPRWFGGFSVVSYPPLVHQLIALAGLLIGVDAGYALVSWVILSAYPLGIYAFSRIFVSRSAAAAAGLGAAVLPSIYLTAYTFGQLPTLTGALFALFSAAALADFLQTGRRLSAALAVLLVACVLGAHHATLLFLPELFFAVGLHCWLYHPKDRAILLARLTIFGAAAAAAGLVVIWPFWQWGQLQAMQTPIDHATRHNLFQDFNAAFLFFWSPYGPLALLIPFALIQARRRRFIGLGLAFGVLFLLGLGGSTPLPRWVFGPGWEWLTYDRFTFWATLLLLPFFGSWIATLSKRPSIAPAWFKPALARVARLRVRASLALVLFVLACCSMLVSFYPLLLPTQPQPIAMQPIVAFLAHNDNSQWRYLTLGFGDQFAFLNRLTQATTLDGSYFTARTIPELRSSGIGSIDAQYWNPLGLSALDPILQAAGKYGVRWVFLADPKYTFTLEKNGWIERVPLSNGVRVWENPQAVRLPVSTPPVEDPLAVFSWGTLPLLALAITAALAALRLWPAHAQNFLYQLHSFWIGMLPLGLVLWYFRPLTTLEIPRVYFIYDNTLVFLADGLTLAAVLAWAAARWIGPRRAAESVGAAREEGGHIGPPLRGHPAWNGMKEGFRSFQIPFGSVQFWLLILLCLASLSIFWSQDRLVSAGICLQLWLGYALFVSLRDRPNTLRSAALGFCAALGLQIAIGFAEFVSQSTHFLQPLGLVWPGTLTPDLRGASVVQLSNGLRWLRAYGTLPHPNILAVFILAFLTGPAFLFLNARFRVWAFLLFSAGIALLVLTFSRGAWIGLLAGALVWGIKLRHLNLRQIRLLGAGGTAGALAVAIPLHNLIFSRVGTPASSPTEEFSILGRTWLASQALQVIRQHPFNGLGIGSFVLDLARRAGIGYIIEPVHDLPLLIASELGLGSLLLLAGLAIASLHHLRQTRRPAAILLSAGLVALAAASLFDHSLWTLAPGRTLLWLILGLWAGQLREERD